MSWGVFSTRICLCFRIIYYELCNNNQRQYVHAMRHYRIPDIRGVSILLAIVEPVSNHTVPSFIRGVPSYEQKPILENGDQFESLDQNPGLISAV